MGDGTVVIGALANEDDVLTIDGFKIPVAFAKLAELGMVVILINGIVHAFSPDQIVFYKQIINFDDFKIVGDLPRYRVNFACQLLSVRLDNHNNVVVWYRCHDTTHIDVVLVPTGIEVNDDIEIVDRIESNGIVLHVGYVLR